MGPTFGYVNVVVVPSPPALGLSPAGKNAVTTSESPLNMVPALATNTRELFGRMTACVGLTPTLASPMLLSPDTSICRAVPWLNGTLALMAKTAWKFAGLGGVMLMGITTGRDRK